MQGSIQKILHDEPRGQLSMSKGRLLSRLLASCAQSSIDEEIDNETAVRENTTKPVENAADAKPPAESARLSSSDPVLDKVSMSQGSSKEDKTEPAESTLPNKSSVEPHIASEPPLIGSTSIPNLVIDDLHAMEVDTRVD